MDDEKIIDIEVSFEGQQVTRSFAVEGRALPNNMELILQDMVDTLLDDSEI